ncbi:MAG: MFS transporter [Burkholderiaceae bacterium]
MTIPYSVLRMLIALVLMTVGSSAMYVVVVVLPMVQSEFGVDRADASLPYTLTMMGFGLGGILMGRLSDRYGVSVPVMVGGVGMTLGFWLAATAPALWVFTAAHGILLGLLGSSAMFAPLVADTSLWFTKRRGIAVAICASGNYLAGAVWPPIVQSFSAVHGWRAAYLTMAVISLVIIVPLSFLLRRRAPLADAMAGATVAQRPGNALKAAVERSRTAARAAADTASGAAAVRAGASAPASASAEERPLGMSLGALQSLLFVAGISCCIAMSMPQVHIVALCGDLGFGVARGAEMLSLMLAFGILSRLTSGLICDRIGGLRTLLLGSVLQAVALLLFLPFDSLASLYVISALFGLVQGGIVPSYAIIVREYFSPREAGARVGTVLMATLLGMAIGGWVSGKIFDLTGSYDAAFIHGFAWNALNAAIAFYLLMRARRVGPTLTPSAVLA